MKKISLAYIRKNMPLLEEYTLQCNHQSLVLWSYEVANLLLPYFFEKYPDDTTMIKAMNASVSWREGTMKMPQAKKYCLDAHRWAKYHKDDLICGAIAHSIGQMVGVIHTPKHAMGVIYYVQALILLNQPKDPLEFIQTKELELIKLLQHFQALDKSELPWIKHLQLTKRVS